MTEFKISAYKEVVLSVRNLERDKRIYQELGEWENIHEEDVSTDQLAFWDLPASASARSVILKYEDYDAGMIRLISFSGVEQRHIRSSSQSWDTGGIYDIDLRTVDISTKIEQFQAYGWTGFSDVKRYQFNEFNVSEILMKGSEDMVVALIERHEPALEHYPNLKGLSHVFNSSQVVKDLDVSKHFYLDQLGFNIFSEYVGVDGENGPNIFGIPHNVHPSVKRKLCIVSPTDQNQGSVELVQLEGLTGRDFSEFAVPPHLGILMLRYPVQNLSAYVDFLQKNKVALHREPTTIMMEPYGMVEAIVVRSPDGAWIEFYEPRDS